MTLDLSVEEAGLLLLLLWEAQGSLRSGTSQALPPGDPPPVPAASTARNLQLIAGLVDRIMTGRPGLTH